VRKIEAVARGLTKRYGTSSPFSLCDYLKIGVMCLDLPERTGGFCLQREQGGYVIVLNSALRPAECGFCCAHELGHVLLHPGLNEQAMTDLTDLCTQKLENEADYFAACLYIDPHLPEWHERFDPLTVTQIASLSGLPERIVRLRFREKLS
jgi:Zn-dependent peptidase ImmA (M78 family)